MDRLHRLRSALARVQAEAELLELDGTGVEGVMSGLAVALAELEGLEEAAASPPVAVVLEDEERLGVLTVRGLVRCGVPAVLATSLEPALRLAAAGAVLVADLSALAGEAETSAAAIHAVGPIIISGGTSAEARTLADGLGARAYFLKPVDHAELAAVVRTTQAARGR